MHLPCNKELRAIGGPRGYAWTMGKVPAMQPVGDFASVEAVLDHLRSRGNRVTNSRRILLEVLFAAEGHRSAEALGRAVQARSPDVHMSTIYRNLDELEQAGIVTHSHLGHGPSAYLLTSQAHAHFMCAECGAMIEAPAPMFRDLARSAKERFGFSIDPKHFAILGRCASCGG